MSTWVRVTPPADSAYGPLLSSFSGLTEKLTQASGNRLVSRTHTAWIELFRHGENAAPADVGVIWQDLTYRDTPRHLLPPCTLTNQQAEAALRRFITNTCGQPTWHDGATARFTALGVATQAISAASTPNQPQRPELWQVATKVWLAPDPARVHLSGPGAKTFGLVVGTGEDEGRVVTLVHASRVFLDDDTPTARQAHADARTKVDIVKATLSRLRWRRAGDRLTRLFPAFYALAPSEPQTRAPLCWFASGLDADGTSRSGVYSFAHPLDSGLDQGSAEYVALTDSITFL